DQPDGGGRGVGLFADQGQAGEGEPDVARAHISHENAGWWPVPYEEASAGRCRGHGDERRPGRAAFEQQRAAHATHGDRFGGSEAVDAVHEVVEIRGPHDRENTECSTPPAERDHVPGEIDRTETPDREDKAAGGREMYDEANEWGESTTIVEPAHHGD